jgi:hypothetical protein
MTYGGRGRIGVGDWGPNPEDSETADSNWKVVNPLECVPCHSERRLRLVIGFDLMYGR